MINMKSMFARNIIPWRGIIRHYRITIKRGSSTTALPSTGFRQLTYRTQLDEIIKIWGFFLTTSLSLVISCIPPVASCRFYASMLRLYWLKYALIIRLVTFFHQSQWSLERVHEKMKIISVCNLSQNLFFYQCFRQICGVSLICVFRENKKGPPDFHTFQAKILTRACISENQE